MSRTIRRQCELPTDPSDPRKRLARLLCAWSNLVEADSSESSVLASYHEIMTLFEDPKADLWFSQWREANPIARLV